jgi:photosystem II stability/assembly factor-like uncharacterized protein
MLLRASFLLSLLMSACTSPNPSTSPVTENTLPPYSPDTPSPPGIDAPLIESPALVNIHFLNELDGWGVTESQIVRTNDGGITWYNLTPPNVTETGYSVRTFALDANHFWMQIPDFADFHNGSLHRTTDGGLTWTTISTPFSGADLQFLDANNGWALADLGVGAGSNAVSIFQTIDGGATWTQKFTNDPNLPNSGDSLPLGGLKSGIAPVNMQTAFVYGVTYASGTIYLFRTDDSGATWTPVTTLPLPAGAENSELGVDPEHMQFVSSTVGFMAVRMSGASSQTALYVTADAGNNWSLTSTLLPGGGSADFLSAEDLVFYNGEQFYVTRDAARTWSIIPPDVNFGDTFAVMDFVNALSGWVITIDPTTNQRSLYRTTDGGATWSPLIP